MITFNSQQEFDEAVMNTLHRQLSICVSSRYGSIEVSLRDHTEYPCEEITSDSASIPKPFELRQIY